LTELGRVDILTETSMMASQQASPRVGHLEQVFHMFAYLKSHENSTMVFDPLEPVFDESKFQECDWSEMYPDAAEVVARNIPEPQGKAVRTSCFIDADHAGCRVQERRDFVCESSSHCVVIEETDYSREFNVWIRNSGVEDCN